VNLLLIGLRGAGKSRCGAAAAAALGRAFVDLDARTAASLDAATVAEAWRSLGEPAFREAEARALAHTLAADGQVIACGGGTPTAPGVVELVEAERATGRARVVYLRAPAAALAARLSDSDSAERPSLTGAGMIEEIPVVFARRDPLYLSLADLVIETEGLTVDETTALIIAAAQAPLPAGH
jgi:shikimate kinase